MKNFFVSMLKSKNSGRKIATIAVIVTSILLVVSLWILIVSSAAFALFKSDGNKKEDAPVEPDIIYTSVSSIDDHLVASDSLVNVRDNRSKLSSDATNQYYATSSRDIMLTSNAQKALDKMLVAFYNMNKAKVVTDVSLPACNIPTVSNTSNGGLTFKLDTFNDKSVADDTIYSWIFTNAAKYGFVYTGSYFTYVGTTHATIMSKNSISDMDAYVTLLKNGAVKMNVTDNTSGKTGNFTVYFIANGTELSVPANYSYTAEAVNDGYIVTVDMSKVIG